jgi:hypothetical protein
LDAGAGTVHADPNEELAMGERSSTVMLVLAATIALLGLAACSGGAGAQGKKSGGNGATAAGLGPLADVTDPSPAAGAAAARPRKPTGPAILVTWEALAREKYLLENSRFRRRNQPQPPQKITLLSASHPEAKNVKRARSKADREKYAGSAVLSDQDMLNFMKGLKQQGFYRYARPSGFDSAIAGSDSARGRIIVEANGQSHTLISMRGQGQNANTKGIPKIYSETKQAVMVLRNMTPTLNVTHYGASGSVR